MSAVFPKAGSWEDKLYKQQKWLHPLKFHESWYLLGLVGFTRMHEAEWVFEDPDGRYRRHPSKKHQEGEDAIRHFLEVFTDRFAEAVTSRATYEYHAPLRASRDDTIPIAGRVVCARCGQGPTTMVIWGEEDNPRPRRLERDHIVALQYGGNDVSENLQWLCYICHKFKTAEEEILYKLDKLRAGTYHLSGATWRIRMWEQRLKVLRERNPPGKEYYSWYIDDPSTAYDLFYKTREKARKEPSPKQMPAGQMSL